MSSYYYWAARGVDERPVRADRIRKSVGAENTFPADLFAYEASRDALREIVDKVWSYCERSGIRGRTVTLKVKFANFRIITRSRTGQIPVRTRSELEQLGDAPARTSLSRRERHSAPGYFHVFADGGGG